MGWNGNTFNDDRTPSNVPPGQDFFSSPRGFLITALVLALLFAVNDSWYTVQTEERAVVLRLGAYQSTSMPGFHFKLPLLDRYVKLKTTTVLEQEFGTGNMTRRGRPTGSSRTPRAALEESLMLTGDLNVADVQWVVQYRIANPRQFLFNVRDPEKNIRDISQATMRRVVGDRTVTNVLRREGIAAEAKAITQKILDDYGMGIEIIDVKLQNVTPPERVRPSFNEVNAAKQEQEKAINEAESEYNRAIPRAVGEKEQAISEAQGYALAITNRAKGDAEKFRKIVEAYNTAPELTRTRLFLESAGRMLSRTPAITFIDPEIRGVLPLLSGSVPQLDLGQGLNTGQETAKQDK